MKKIYTLVLFSFCCYHASGQVGIGTDNPKAGLHVADSSVVFTADGEADDKGTLPVSGVGRRFFWYAGQAALRSGYVQRDQWNREKIGSYSFGAGYNVVASGSASVAIGSAAIASGYGAVAMGSGTEASGYASTAFGEHTKASGTQVTAMGAYTTASGLRSTALGGYSTASGSYSTAMGSNTTASGKNSIAMGFETTASGDRSTAMGRSTSATGTNSAAFGDYTNATGDYSTAIGSRTEALGNASIAMGLSTVATSFAETVIGRYNLEDYDASKSEWIPENKIFSVGNGTDLNNRKNALTILKNGNTGIGISAPVQRFEVDGNVKSNAVLLATADGTASPLNHYEESTSNSQLYNGSLTYLSSYSIKIVRVGKMVTLSFAADALTMNVTRNDIVFSGIPQISPSNKSAFPHPRGQ